MQVDLWDISTMQKVRTFTGHKARVSALSWNSHLLSTGGSDRVILHRDMRVPEDSVTRLQGHSGEVAGLKVTYSLPSEACWHSFQPTDHTLSCAQTFACTQWRACCCSGHLMIGN